MNLNKNSLKDKNFIVKFFYIVLLFILLINIFNFSAYADNADGSKPKTVKVQLKGLEAGVPINQGVFRAVYLERAFEKISSGKYEKDDFSTSYFQKLGQTFKIEGNVVTLNSKLKIGQDISLDREQALEAMKIIYNSGNPKFLQSINGDNLHFPNVYIFTVPNNSTRLTTDTEGNGAANIPVGISGITYGGGFIMDFVDIKDEKDQKLTIDIVNTSDEISATANTSSKKELVMGSPTIVEYGQNISYKVTIKKDFFENEGMSIKVSSNPNLVIDNISAESTRQEEFPPILDTQKSQDLDKFIQNIVESYKKNSIYSYEIKVPKSSSDYELTINAHIQKTVEVGTRLTNSPAITDEESLTNIKFIDDDENITQGKGIKISSTNGNGRVISYTSAKVASTGINFITVNGEKDEVLASDNFLLGKNVNNEKYLYSTSGIWVKINSDLSKVNSNDFMKLTGNNVYSISDKNPKSLELNDNVFDFNAEEQKEINRAIFKIRGLAEETDYFIYDLNGKIVNAEDSVKNFQVNSESIKKSADSDSKVMYQIPDYKVGTEEYNILYKYKEKKSKISDKAKIIVSITVAILIVFLVGIIVLRKK